MKYRVRPSSQKNLPRTKPVFLRLKGSQTVRRLSPKDFYRLEDPEPFLVPKEKQKKRTRFSRIKAALLSRYLSWRMKLRARLARPEGHRTLPLFAGAWLGALTVTALSFAVALLFLFAPLGQSYVSVTVPDFKGRSPDAVLTADAPFNLILHYETNPEVPSGVVISQSPKGGVTRRLYSDEDYLDIVLTVSRPPLSYTLENLTGKTAREAELTLKNRSLSVILAEIPSNRQAGTVLSTDPPVGTSLLAGDSVTLHVSSGQKPRRAYVPDLVGSGESAALDRLRYAGLRAGNIQYQLSPLPPGTVIEQQYPAFSMVEADTSVDLWISLGDRYDLRTVPDLYGLSEERAKELLRQYGLTVGERYSVGNAAPKGTVISQSPPAGTPLTSAIYSVDLFVSAPS